MFNWRPVELTVILYSFLSWKRIVFKIIKKIYFENKK